MPTYGKEKRITVYLEMKIDDPKKYKSILYTDGKNDMWISRRFHSYKHVKNNDYMVLVDPWLAKKLSII